MTFCVGKLLVSTCAVGAGLSETCDSKGHFFSSILGLFCEVKRAGFELQDLLFWVWDLAGNIDSEAK